MSTQQTQTAVANGAAPMPLAEVKQGQHALLSMPADQAVDMFTERGFALANRIAKAYSTSDAVPAQFRDFNLKKAGREEHWIENKSAVGNCLVAIEVARACRMSITAVMQNADMIEGKLRWSGKFVIAAINASGRFTPLRFQTINRGRLKATYKEKTGWDNEARRPTFTERTVDVDDIECIAWALPRGVPEPALTADMLRQYPGRMLDLYRALGMPVVESAPVTMKMAVEEGWYGKSGSKWQTEMRALMFQYRAGTFFGNIHAPDIVMGMGQTSEEARDLAPTFDVAADGTATPVSVADLRPSTTSGPTQMAEVVEAPAAAPAAEPPAQAPAPAPAAAAQQIDQATGEITGGTGQQQSLGGEWEPTAAEKEAIRQRELAEASGQQQAAAAPAPAARRTRAAAGPAVE